LRLFKKKLRSKTVSISLIVPLVDAPKGRESRNHLGIIFLFFKMIVINSVVLFADFIKSKCFQDDNFNLVGHPGFEPGTKAL
jgi:hypothetical protein